MKKRPSIQENRTKKNNEQENKYLRNQGTKKIMKPNNKRN